MSGKEKRGKKKGRRQELLLEMRMVWAKVVVMKWGEKEAEIQDTLQMWHQSYA